MAKSCDCNVGLTNTGTPNCDKVVDVAKKLIIVPTYDSTGALNKIDLTDTFDLTYFTARVNDVDKSKRWFPLPLVKNVENLRGDATFETFNDGSNLFVREGVKTFTGLVVNASHAYFGLINDYGCTDISAYIVDKQGNLIGNGVDEDGFLLPIKIDKNTWYPRYVEPTDTESAKIQLSFEWDITEDDGDIRMISISEMSYNPCNLKGLLDVYGKLVGVVSTTSFAVKLYTTFGTALNPILVEGQPSSAFAIYNETTMTTLAPTAVESPAGTYTFTYTAQTSGDVLQLQLTANGYDDTQLRKVDFIVP
jgi:hypothetical protein